MSTKIEYVFKLMKDQELVCYCIYDVKDTLLYNQKNTSFTVAKAIEEIEEFLRWNNGNFRIELRDDSDKNKAGVNLYSYSVVNLEKQDAPINGITGSQYVNPAMLGVPSGSEFFALLQQKETELRQLQAEAMAKTMEFMREKHDLSLQLINKQAEINQAKSEDNFKDIAMGALQSLLGGGMNVGVSGINEVTETDTNSRINASVRTLMKLDPDFVNNIEALARVALEKPSIYKMAVNQLKSL